MFNTAIALLCAIAAAAAPPGMAAGASAGPAVVERTVFLMGTLLRARVVAADEATAEAAASAAFAEVARLEAVLSTWQPTAELSQANAAEVGTSHALSSELTALLAEAGSWVERTGGAFDPAVGALIDVWGLRTGGRGPTPAELRAARAASGWSPAVLDTAAATLTRPDARWWLDSGGFGKGAALRAAARVLAAHGAQSFVLDFGGQVLQHEVDAAASRIAVAHPAERSRAVATLSVRSGSVATSGASERWVEHAGERLGHILDPRTGEPVRAWGSVTVVAADALAADVLSTALFVMGADAALAWSAARREYGVLVLARGAEGRVCARWNTAMESWLVEPPAENRAACGGEERPVNDRER